MAKITTGRLSHGPNVREFTGRKVGSFDESVFSEVKADVLSAMSKLIS